MRTRSSIVLATLLILAVATSCGTATGRANTAIAGSQTTTSAPATISDATVDPASTTPDATTTTAATRHTTTTRPPRTTTTRLPAAGATHATPTTATPTARTTAPRSIGEPGLASAAGKVVVLDAGHNGANGSHTAEINRLVDVGNGTKACNTTGTASNDGYAEAAFTWDVTTRVMALLSSAGAQVVLTRTNNDGWGPCIDQRAAVANQAHADATVSIHADGAGASSRGFHVIYPLAVHGLNDQIVEPSTRLARSLRAAFGSVTGLPPSNYIGHDGLIARDDLGGLNLAKVPAVFIECGNMRNATDVAVMKSSDGRQRIARGIAAGIAAYLGGH